DAGVVPEHVLGAVAVVGVDVDDQDPLAPLGQRGGGHGHVVEEAEAHGRDRGGVVAGRSQRAERGLGLAGVERLDGGEAGAGGEERGVVGGGAGGGVPVEPAPAGGRGGGHPVDVGAGVDPLDVGARRSSGPAAVQGLVEAGGGHAV